MSDAGTRKKAKRRPAASKAVPAIADQALKSLTSGVIALDAQGAVILANPAATAYLGMELPAGRMLADLPVASPFLEVMREVMKTRQTLTRRELKLDLARNLHREIGLSASLLEGPQDFNGVIFLFTDMTERRALERSADLNRQLAQIGELTAGVVHELRNPLSVISGMAELLLRRFEPGAEEADIVHTILAESKRLEESIGQFLGFARPFDLEYSYCCPEDIVRRAAQLCQRQAEKKSARLDTLFEENLPEIRADLSRAAQALSNLIGNAIDAVPADGWVRVSVRRDEGRILFDVMDNGPGIHLAPREDLFSPFFTKKEGGTGLGLSIVHRIVTAHGGAVSFVNRAEGGACFTMWLPVEQCHAT